MDATAEDSGIMQTLKNALTGIIARPSGVDEKAYHNSLAHAEAVYKAAQVANNPQALEDAQSALYATLPLAQRIDPNRARVIAQQFILPIKK